MAEVGCLSKWSLIKVEKKASRRGDIFQMLAKTEEAGLRAMGLQLFVLKGLTYNLFFFFKNHICVGCCRCGPDVQQVNGSSDSQVFLIFKAFPI